MGRDLEWGEPAPWFEARTPGNSRFHFDTVAGRRVVLCFFGSAEEPGAREVLGEVMRRRAQFDDDHVAFFGVTVDPEDERAKRIVEDLPGVHFFLDFDRRVSRLFGAAPEDATTDSPLTNYRQRSIVLDERLRVLATIEFAADARRHVAQVMHVLSSLPPLEPEGPAPPTAPILVVPRIFEPRLCRDLIDHYGMHGGEESGFMREVDGRTVLVHDHSHKRRRDQEIREQPLRNECMVRIHDRLVPEIQKAFQFQATRIERYIVACYDSTFRGHFRAHRDNLTRGTAHRRFAVSVNLNTGEYEGDDLRFPEFGRQLYRAPLGGAIVFSCTLLHEATPVSQGTRYAFLPFLYDDAAARLREENRKFLGLEQSQETGS